MKESFTVNHNKAKIPNTSFWRNIIFTVPNHTKLLIKNTSKLWLAIRNNSPIRWLSKKYSKSKSSISVQILTRFLCCMSIHNWLWGIKLKSGPRKASSLRSAKSWLYFKPASWLWSKSEPRFVLTQRPFLSRLMESSRCCTMIWLMKITDM